MRNSAFNAAPYSLNGQTAQKPYSANNNLNANIGGPLHIPKIVNWQRAQYTISFGTSHQPQRQEHGGLACPQRRSATAISRRPLVARTPVTIYDPLSGSPFPNNVIPQSALQQRVGGTAAVLSRTRPIASIVQNYRFVITDPSNSRNIGVRFNAPLNNKDRLNFNFQKQNSELQLAPALRVPGYRHEQRAELLRRDGVTASGRG